MPQTPRSILSRRSCVPDHLNGDGPQDGSLLQDDEAVVEAPVNLKKVKRVRLLLDVRTELTDEELKVRDHNCY